MILSKTILVKDVRVSSDFCQSALQVSDVRWKQRVEVCGEQPNKLGTFTFSMLQRVGGHFDGIWYTSICDGLA